MRFSKKIAVILLICAAAQAELSVGIGHTWGRYLETLSVDNNGRRSVQQGVLPGRLSLWYELDAYKHPLFLDNDQVVFGVGVLQEARYREALLPENRTLIIPLYATYYLNYGQWGIGAGLNLALMDIRTTHSTTMLSQQLGKQVALRYNFPGWYAETMLMQNCAAGDFARQGTETSIFYDMTQYVIRCGWYLEKN